MSDVRTQFDYYLAHQDQLVAKYNGRFVVIVNEKVVGDFESEKDAYAFATKTYEPGKFLIQRVSPGNQDYSQTFHSRASVQG